MSELINADFSRRVVIATAELPWIQSPQIGVERRMLDRIGGEVARATSLVRYAPGSVFPAHDHALGEEFLVLGGVFSDENGDYAAGTYVRNPPGSRHAPRTSPGCTILVKLRQMALDDHVHVVINATQRDWQTGEIAAHSWLLLHSACSLGERVMMERLEAGARLPATCVAAGEEIFVLSGELEDESGRYGPNTWIRNPAGYTRGLSSRTGVAYWSKRNHLRFA